LYSTIQAMINQNTSRLLTTSAGNNSISRDARRIAWSELTISLPSIRTISSLTDVHLGQDIVLEEIDHNGQLQSYTWLAHLYRHDTLPLWIMDNHNYALYARYQHIHPSSPQLIHIDSHADMNTPLRSPSSDDIDHDKSWRKYVTHQTTIASFIQPAQQLWQISDIQQIRSHHALEHLSITKPFILDIDLDFRMDNTQIPSHHLSQLRTILHHEYCHCITIATSPCFLDQQIALHMLIQIYELL
jgi:hypothetical protein